jgi:hypothetical protein
MIVGVVVVLLLKVRLPIEHKAEVPWKADPLASRKRHLSASAFLGKFLRVIPILTNNIRHKMAQFANSTDKDKGEPNPDQRESAASGQATPNGTLKRRSEDGEGSRKRRRRRGVKGHHRRNSVSKPARDPRDDPSPPGLAEEEISDTRSPSPVIDFDGLSRPSRSLQPLPLFRC